MLKVLNEMFEITGLRCGLKKKLTIQIYPHNETWEIGMGVPPTNISFRSKRINVKNMSIVFGLTTKRNGSTIWR